MDAILKLLFASPVSRRVVTALLQRGLAAAGGAIATYLALGGDFAPQWAAFSDDLIAVLIPIVVAWIAVLRAKTTEKTIAVASDLPFGTSRERIDLEVKAR